MQAGPFGAAPVANILMSKVSLTDALLPSVAVTFTDSVVPALACGGLPENVRVEGVQASHDGSAEPSASVAV